MSCAGSCSTRRWTRRAATGAARADPRSRGSTGRIGRNFYRLVDLMTMSADEYLARWFEHGVNRRCWPITARSAPSRVRRGRARRTSCCTTSWASTRAPAAGGSSAAAWARSARRSPRPAAGTASRSARTPRWSRSRSTEGARPGRHGRGRRVQARAVASNASCKVLFDRLVAPRAACRRNSCEHIRRLPHVLDRLQDQHRRRRLPRYAAFDPAKCGFASPNYTHIGPTVEYLAGRLRRRLPRRLVARALHHRRGADHRRRHAGAARQARGQSVRRSCAVPAGEGELGRRAGPLPQERAAT